MVVVLETILRKPSFLKPSNHPITVCYLLYYIVSMIAIERVPHHTLRRTINQLTKQSIRIVNKHKYYKSSISVIERISYPIYIKII